MSSGRGMGGGLVGGVVSVCKWIVGGIVGVILGGVILYYVSLGAVYGSLMLVQGPAKGIATGNKISDAAWMAAGVVHGTGAQRKAAYDEGVKAGEKSAPAKPKSAPKSKSAPAKTTKS